MKTTKSPATYAARINNALRDAGISPEYRPFSECERLLLEAMPEKFATIYSTYKPKKTK